MLAIRLPIAVAACAAALAGCSSGASEGALDNALGYLPADSPFVVAFATDPEGDQIEALQTIVERFPFSGRLTEGLEQGLASEEVDFEEDVKPLLGNQLVVGATDAESFVNDSSDDRFVAAIEVKDEAKLEELLERQDVEQVGEQAGATLYESPTGDSVAVEDGVLVVAGTDALLEAALERKDGEDALSADAFGEATEGVADDGLVRLSFDLEQLIDADPDTQEARKIEWFGALRSFALSASFDEDSAAVEFRLATDSEELTEEDLPIAAGDDSPAVIDRSGEIGLGVREPEQILAFAENAGQAIDPEGFGDYSTGRQALEKRLDLDIDEDLLGRLEDDVSVGVGLDGNVGLRAGVKDPDGLTKTLDKLGQALPEIAEGALGGGPIGYAKPEPGEDFYALGSADGDSVVYGVVDDVFVLANDARRATRLAGDETREVEGAEGSIAMSADAQQLVARAVSRLGGGGIGGALGGSLISGPLGDFTGSVAADTDGLTGRFELTFD